MDARLQQLYELQARLHELSRWWVRALPRLRELATPDDERPRRLRIRRREVRAGCEKIAGLIGELIQVESTSTKEGVR